MIKRDYGKLNGESSHETFPSLSPLDCCIMYDALWVVSFLETTTVINVIFILVKSKAIKKLSFCSYDRNCYKRKKSETLKEKLKS
jgi:hypothetical protein